MNTLFRQQFQLTRYQAWSSSATKGARRRLALMWKANRRVKRSCMQKG